MANRKYVYIQLYPKDLMADEKLAKCDRPGAWGAYLALLNIMAMEPVRGCIRLRDWDTRPDNKRYSLVANFEKANSLRVKATAFAKVVSQCTPLKGKSLVDGIEQLITFGVVVMHGDALIQPRMFRESKSRLEGYKPEPETEESVALQVTDNSTASTASTTVHRKHPAQAPAIRANMRDSVIENESENKDNSIGNIGGVGVRCGAVVTEHSDGDKNDGSTADDGFKDFWMLYDKRYVGGSRIHQADVRAAWRSLTDDERAAAMAFIPQYVAATPLKQYRKHPRNFLEERAWLTITIDGDGSIDNRSSGSRTPQQPFVPPTQDEVTAYCQEKGYTFDPIEFWNHYEANGWVQGRNKPIKKWQACCVTWQQHKNNGEFTHNRNNETANRHHGGHQDHPTDSEVIEQSQRIIERKLRKNGGDTE